MALSFNLSAIDNVGKWESTERRAYALLVVVLFVDIIHRK